MRRAGSNAMPTAGGAISTVIFAIETSQRRISLHRRQ
jgi:hypothetical protein